MSTNRRGGHHGQPQTHYNAKRGFPAPYQEPQPYNQGVHPNSNPTQNVLFHQLDMKQQQQQQQQQPQQQHHQPQPAYQNQTPTVSVAPAQQSIFQQYPNAGGPPGVAQQIHHHQQSGYPQQHAPRPNFFPPRQGQNQGPRMNNMVNNGPRGPMMQNMQSPQGHTGLQDPGYPNGGNGHIAQPVAGPPPLNQQPAIYTYYLSPAMQAAAQFNSQRPQLTQQFPLFPNPGPPQQAQFVYHPHQPYPISFNQAHHQLQTQLPQFIPGTQIATGIPPAQMTQQPIQQPPQQNVMQRPIPTPTPPNPNQQMAIAPMVQQIVQQQAMPPPISQYQGYAQPTPQPPKKRPSAAIAIIDPSSGKEIDVGSSNDSKPATLPQTDDTTSEPSSAASSTTAPTLANKSAEEFVPIVKEAPPKKKEEEISQPVATPVTTPAASCVESQDRLPAKVSEPSKVELQVPVAAATEPAKLSEKSTANQIHSVGSSDASLKSLDIPVVPPPSLSASGLVETINVNLSPSPATSSPSSNTEYEPISPTPLPDTPKNSSEDFIDAKSKNKKKTNQSKRSELNPKAEEDEAFRDSSTSNSTTSTAYVSPVTTPDAPPPGIPVPLVKPVDPVPVMSVEKDENHIDGKRDHSEPRQVTPPKVTSEGTNHVNDEPVVSQDGDNETDKLDQDNDSNLSSKSGSQIKLRYEYKDDQWSPINMEGKKQYDRNFLLMLQNDPLSMERPPNLPHMDIVKDRSLPLMQKPSSNQPKDWMPGFIKNVSTRQSSIQKKPSRDGRDGRENKRPMMPPPKIIDVKIEKVELHQTENAWRPAKLNETNGELSQSTNDVLMRKARGILNKLCPQKFDRLVEKFNELQIDTEEKLRLCMELVFEKAVDEPGFSVAYARMCEVLQKKQVMVDTPSGGPNSKQPVNFRKLLVSKCQQEFERDYLDGLDKLKYEADLAAAANEEARKEIQLEWEEKERNARRRSLGNIRFIGELYKLKMLTAKIMHECIKKLLKSSDEESLECLSRLLTTVGKDLEQETNIKFKSATNQEEMKRMGLYSFDVYFKEIGGIIEQKNTSSRVRFMLQDLVDLRKSFWKPRRDVAGPKTIDQIHEEAEQEKTKQQLMNDYAGGGRGRDRDIPGFAGSGSQMRGGPNDRNDPRKKSGRGPNQAEEGWTNVQPSKASQRSNAFDKIDTHKIQNLAQNYSRKVDVDTIQLGPGSTRSNWGQGSGSMRLSRNKEDPMPNTNKFAMLHQDSGPASISGYPSVPPPQMDNSGYDPRRSGVGPSRSMGMPGRGSRGPSVETERKRAVEAVRFNSKPNGPASMRDFSESSVSRVHHVDEAEAQKGLFKGPLEMSVEDAEKQSRLLLDEYLSCRDEEDAIATISSRFTPAMMPNFVDYAINKVLERTLENRQQIGKFLSTLIIKHVILRKQFESGLGALMECVGDVVVDIPMLWDYLGEILAPMFLSNTLPLSFLSTCGPPVVEGYPGKYLAGVLRAVAVQENESRAAELWKTSGLELANFVHIDDIPAFVKSSKLEFLSGTSELSAESIHDELTRLLKENPKHNDEIISWVDSKIGSKQSEPFFVRILMTAVAESAITGMAPNQVTFSADKMTERKNLLVHFLDSKYESEMQALYALQQLMHRLEHPNKLLHQIMNNLYENDVITESAFYAWEACDNPAEQEGKGVAIKSTTQFFTWLREPDD